MRIVLFSDIHGNSIALDAVLNDIKKLGPIDAYWILGDLVGIGPDPVGVMDRLYRLNNAQIILGNTDRYVLTGKRPQPKPQAIASDTKLLPLAMDIAGSFAWTQGAITAAGWLEWLGRPAKEVRYTLPDGTKMLGVHASPGKDNGSGIHPGLSQSEICKLVKGCKEDLLFVGHTHWPLDMTVGSMRIVNLGSVSNPLPPDLRACYTVLDADSNGFTLEQRRVEYNHQAVIAAVERVRHPAAGYITRLMRGEHQPGWVK
ncbi:MAG: metallophosphoesterase [Chloroflexota bacterium]